MQDRVQRLEEIIAFQEDAIERLHQLVREHQITIHKLNERFDSLEKQVRASQPSPVIAPKDDVPPPHY